MHRHKLALTLLLGEIAPFLNAQIPASSPADPSKLVFVLPTLLDRGVEAADPALRPFLRATIAPNWLSLNAAAAIKLSNLPIQSPATSIEFTMNKNIGIPNETVRSRGSVLTERAETLGEKRLFFAVTYQRFLFDRLDDVDLGGLDIAVPLTNPIGGATAPTQTLLNLSGSAGFTINQVTAHITMGLKPWLDVSYALPIVSSSLSVRAGGTLRDLSRDQLLLNLPTQLIEASATGLGDGIARLKARIERKTKTDESNALQIAVAADFRVPTGDELNYHGAGAYGVKPFVIVSLNRKKLSPHVNAGYQWNGKSFLASEFVNTKRRLPAQLFYAAGFDAALSSKVTASFDVLDQVIINGQQTLARPFTTSTGTSRVLSFEDRSWHEFNAAIGFKAHLRKQLVMTGNLLMRLNNTGLRTRVIPLVGFSYVFE